MAASDVIKPRLIVYSCILGNKAIVGPVFDVLVQRHHVHVLQTDVDADPGLAVPEEISLLFDVRHVVGRL